MRAVVQRVAQATVTGGGATASIDRGLCVLLGITTDDTSEDSNYIVKKLLNLKIFPDDGESSGWKKSVLDVRGEILMVSQFTLHAVYKGMKPSFHRSMAPADAEHMFLETVAQLKANYEQDRVAHCVFGSYMNVSLVNDGPVTLILDSREPKGG
mmetsp:Transcript_20055/g.80345  ORF Transcript_20055/g.80345 Transcript_20055/m.80345 type:complete len:154 (-) Transcript_20055:3282-3743(-)